MPTEIIDSAKRLLGTDRNVIVVVHQKVEHPRSLMSLEKNLVLRLSSNLETGRQSAKYYVTEYLIFKSRDSMALCITGWIATSI